jgi:uncharacterized protein
MTVLKVKVKPNSKQVKIVQELDGSWTVHLHAPPVDGKANQELLQLLSKHFKVPKSQIIIRSGLSSKYKSIELPD